jgi:malate dehydrogenase (oxaloacetate-decarboxylating)
MSHTSVVLRVELDHKVATFGDVAAVISKAGGDITSIDVIRPGKDTSIRDITVDVAETE